MHGTEDAGVEDPVRRLSAGHEEETQQHHDNTCCQQDKVQLAESEILLVGNSYRLLVLLELFSIVY